MNLPPLADCQNCGAQTRDRDPWDRARCLPCQRQLLASYRLSQLADQLELRAGGLSASAQASQHWPIDGGAPRPLDWGRP